MARPIEVMTMATKRVFQRLFHRGLKPGFVVIGTLSMGLVAVTFVSCSGDKDRRKLRSPTASPRPPVTTQLADDPSVCVPLSSTFLTEVWAPVVASTCVRCHGQGGVGSGSGFALPVPSDTQISANLTKLQVHDLVQVWRTVGTGDNLTGVLERITGARYHGGGTIYTSDAPQLGGLRRFDRAAQSAEDCVTFNNPLPSASPVVPSPAPNPPDQGLSAETQQACRSAYQAYTAGAAQVVNTNCAPCHGPGQGQLSFGISVPPASATARENAIVFAALANYGLPNKTSLLVDKPTGVTPHGGGAITAPGSAEATALQALVASLNTNSAPLQACLAAIKADPGTAASIWGL
jgi:mono/diheme cytochrome c family protein